MIYVKAIRELLESAVDVRGLAHITGDGFLNLLRLEAHAGYRIDAPLPCRPCSCHRRARRRGGRRALRGLQHGLRLLRVVPPDDTDAALELLGRHHPGSEVIGKATTATGVVELPKQGLIGRRRRGLHARVIAPRARP